MSKYIKINGTTVFEYDLFDTSNSKAYSVILKTDNAQAVAKAFKDISSIELYLDEMATAKYTDWGTYASLSLVNGTTSDSDGENSMYIKVVLKKLNVEEKLKQLEQLINPFYDIKTMTTEELQNYVIMTTSETCRDIIYAGCDITLTDGTVEHFTFNADDQVNLKELFDIVYMTQVDMPYHKNGDNNNCEIYSWKDIVLIYQTLSAHKLYHTTYQNGINNYIPSETDRTTLLAFKYGDTLPEEYMKNIDKMVTQSQKAVNAILTNAGLSTGEDTSVEEDVDTIE